jgi:hypothetical protein
MTNDRNKCTMQKIKIRNMCSSTGFCHERLATTSVHKAIIKAEAKHYAKCFLLSVLKENSVSNTAHGQAGSTLILYVAGTKQIVARTLLSYDSL